MNIQKISSPEETRERMGKWLDTTRYEPKPAIKKDKHGMPIIAPEPEDPDDE